MKKVQLLPSVITAFGLSCGLFVIFKMNMTGLNGADQQVLTATAALLLLASLADVLDGAIARAMKAETTFGGHFDSLADAITFGVAPSVIVLKSLSATSGSELAFWSTIAAMVYSVCGVLRLVRFNVTAQKDAEILESGDDGKKNFTGLPIPAAAAAVVSANLLLASEEFQHFVTVDREVRGWILCAIMIVTGYFMISRWKFPSLKRLHVRVASFKVVFATVLFAVIVFYGILHHFAIVYSAMAWTYLLVSWSLSLVRKISGKQSKALEEFEPDPDDPDELR